MASETNRGTTCGMAVPASSSSVESACRAAGGGSSSDTAMAVPLGRTLSMNTNIFDFCTSPSGEYLVADNGFQDRYNPSLNRLPKVMHRLPSAADWVAFPIPQGPLGPVMYALAAVADSRSGRGPLIFAGGMATCIVLLTTAHRGRALLPGSRIASYESWWSLPTGPSLLHLREVALRTR